MKYTTVTVEGHKANGPVLVYGVGYDEYYTTRPHTYTLNYSTEPTTEPIQNETVASLSYQQRGDGV